MIRSRRGNSLQSQAKGRLPDCAGQLPRKHLVLWKFEKGKRTSVKWVRNTPTATKQWHDLKNRINGTKLEGYLDGKLYLEDTLAQPV